MVSAKLAEFEAEIDRQEARLARATEANVVTLHPAAIAIYLDAVEQLAKALSASDAKAACLKLRELIDCIVVAPRVKPGDPIHFEVRGRLAALMQPDPGRASVGALVPRGGIEPSPIPLKVRHFLNGDFPVYLPVDPALSSRPEGATLCRHTQVMRLSRAIQMTSSAPCAVR
jgi:hypothetical protein